MNKAIFIILVNVFAAILTNSTAFGQSDFYKGTHFSRKDSLFGGSRAERACFDVLHYAIDIKVDVKRKSISGSNTISYMMRYPASTIQVDLYRNMQIDSIIYNGRSLNYERDLNAVFISFPSSLQVNKKHILTVYYEGIPTEARKAPWDGGFVWQTDPNGKAWIGVACESAGASLWYPCKDDLGDEPQEGATVAITVPEGLTAVANGRLTAENALPEAEHRFLWTVKSSINNYNINFTIGDFVHFSDTYTSITDSTKLSLDYWVLRDNLAKAQKHFAQVKPILRSFEHYLGKYPFWNDGYKLIETPYVGMEHQSGIAYGNKYMPRYLGGVVPPEFDFDFIILHESGHEYFGNALSCRDHAEMWLHEAFTTYLETLFIEYTQNRAASLRYLTSQKAFIKNKEPLVGPLGVHYDRWDDSDMYYKGAWFLQTIRQTMNNDSLFFATIRGFYDANKFSANGTSTYDFRNSLINTGKIDASLASKIMDQYLNYPRIPTLVYSIKKPFWLFGSSRVRYMWEANIYDFNMPVQMGNPENYTTVTPTSRFARQTILKANAAKNFKIANELSYIETREESKEMKLPKFAKPKKAAGKATKPDAKLKK